MSYPNSILNIRDSSEGEPRYIIKSVCPLQMSYVFLHPVALLYRIHLLPNTTDHSCQPCPSLGSNTVSLLFKKHSAVLFNQPWSFPTLRLTAFTLWCDLPHALASEVLNYTSCVSTHAHNDQYQRYPRYIFNITEALIHSIRITVQHQDVMLPF